MSLFYQYSKVWFPYVAIQGICNPDFIHYFHLSAMALLPGVGITIIFYSSLLQIQPRCPKPYLCKTVLSISSIKKAVSFHLGSCIQVSISLQWHELYKLSIHMSLKEHVDLIVFFHPYLWHLSFCFVLVLNLCMIILPYKTHKFLKI